MLLMQNVFRKKSNFAREGKRFFNEVLPQRGITLFKILNLYLKTQIMVPGVVSLYLGLDIEIVKRYNKLLHRCLDADLISHVFCFSGKGNSYNFW